MCTLWWRIVFGQVVLIQGMSWLVVGPWRWCSGNKNPCTWWCLGCNRWLCWVGLIHLAIFIILFDILATLTSIAVLGICETLCILLTIFATPPRCFAFSDPPPPPVNLPPVAQTDGPYRGVVGQMIAMSASASSDP